LVGALVVRSIGLQPYVHTQDKKWKIRNFIFSREMFDSRPGKLEHTLPDGLLSNQKSTVGLNLAGFAMEDAGIFYGHLVHCTVFCYISWTIGTFRSHFGIFFSFWYFAPKNLASLRT
jgi:hypothetical protein